MISAILLTSTTFASNYECAYDSNYSIFVVVDRTNQSVWFQDIYKGRPTGQSSGTYGLHFSQVGAFTEVYSGAKLYLKISSGAAESQISFFADLGFVDPSGKTLNCLNR